MSWCPSHLAFSEEAALLGGLRQLMGGCALREVQLHFLEAGSWHGMSCTSLAPIPHCFLGEQLLPLVFISEPAGGVFTVSHTERVCSPVGNRLNACLMVETTESQT